MKKYLLNKHLFLLLIISCILSINISFAVEYDFKELANDVITENLEKTKIAVVVKLKNSGVSKGSASAIQDAIITAIQRRASKLGHTVLGREELNMIASAYEIQEGEEVDFEKLYDKAKTELLVSVTLKKINSDTAQITAKLVGVVGDKQGQILAASNTYEVKFPEAYVVYIEGIFSGKKRKEAYETSLSSGLTTQTAIKIQSSNKSVDFIIKGDLGITVEDTKAEGSEGIGIMKSMLSIGGDSEGGGIMDGIGDQIEASSLKKLIEVTIILKAEDTLNDTIITAECIKSSEIPRDSPKSKIKSEAKKVTKESIYCAAKQLSAKMLGIEVASEEELEADSLLD